MYFSHDTQLTSKNSHKQAPLKPDAGTTFHAPLDTQQFGVSLQFIKEHNNNEVIPPILKQCVEFLSQPEGKLLEYVFLALVKQLTAFIYANSFVNGWLIQTVSKHGCRKGISSQSQSRRNDRLQQ